MERIRRFFRSRRGQSMVEMALILPLLLLLVAGVIDVARAFNSQISIINAAREGARYASRFPWLDSDDPDVVDVHDVVREELTNSAVPPDEVDVVVQHPEGTDSGDPVSIMVEYDFPTIVGGLVGVNTIPMRSVNKMVVFGVDETE